MTNAHRKQKYENENTVNSYSIKHFHRHHHHHSGLVGDVAVPVSARQVVKQVD